MFIAATVLSVLLAFAFAGAAAQKLTAATAAVDTSRRFGFPFSRYRLVALPELAGALGLVAGIWLHRLGVAAGLGLTLLMLLALLFHARARDKPPLMIPAAVLGLLSAVVAWLWAGI